MLSITHRFILLVLVSLSLTGCFGIKPTTEQLCEEHGALQCQELNMRDGQCRHQRDELILNRFDVLKTNSDLDKLKTLQATLKYQTCLGSAAQIEPITAKEIKSKRTEALLHTYDASDALSEELKSSTDPKVLFYRWTVGDKEALRSFLQLENTKELETAELQYALATFYTLRNENKTIQLLNHSLELLTEQDYKNQFHSIIINSLASVNYKAGNKEHAYIWTMVGKAFDLQVASEQQLKLLYHFPEETKQELLITSEMIKDSIKAQNFTVSMLPTINNDSQ